jgi:methyl-accepting chemotaxis protein
MTSLKSLRLTIGRKIYAIIALCFVCFVAVTLYEMRELGQSLRQQKQIELSHLGDVALTIVKEEHAAADKAGLSAAEAQKRAADRLSKLRYGNGDYYWINDMHPRMVMHPTNPKLDGGDLTDNKDPNGKRLFMEMIDVVKRERSGFVAYEWPKPGATQDIVVELEK